MFMAAHTTDPGLAGLFQEHHHGVNGAVDSLSHALLMGTVQLFGKEGVGTSCQWVESGPLHQALHHMVGIMGPAGSKRT